MSSSWARVLLLTLLIGLLALGAWFVFLRGAEDGSETATNPYAGGLPPGTVISTFRVNGFNLQQMTVNENKETFDTDSGFGAKNKASNVPANSNVERPEQVYCFIAKAGDESQARDAATKLEEITPTPSRVDVHGNLACSITFESKTQKTATLVYERAFNTLTQLYDRSKNGRGSEK